MHFGAFNEAPDEQLFNLIGPLFEQADPETDAELFLLGLMIGHRFKNDELEKIATRWANFFPKLESLELEEQKRWLNDYRSASTQDQRLKVRNNFMRRINGLNRPKIEA